MIVIWNFVKFIECDVWLFPVVDDVGDACTFVLDLK